VKNESLLADRENTTTEDGRTMNDTRFTDCSPIFIAGSVRSGTTLLQLLLNAHPNIAIFGELHYFDQLSQIRNKVPSLAGDEDFEYFMSLLKNIDNYQYIPNAENFFGVVKEKFKKEDKRTYENFLRCVLEEYARSQGAARFGEKTPTNIRYLEQLVSIFPHVKILHIVRDPRDVVASSIKMPWTADDAVINSLKWKCDVSYGREFSDRTESYMELRYEDLVYETEEQLKRICSFVGEVYDKKMLDFYKASRTHLKGEPWKDKTQRSIDSAAIKRWSSELSHSQVFIIEKINGSLMDIFGYDRAKVGFYSKLISPVVLARELLKYARYKYADRKKRRTEHPEVIFGGREKLYKMLFKFLK